MKNCLYITLILPILLACGGENTKSEKEVKVANVVSFTEQQIKTIGLELTIPKEQELGVTIFANGKIEVPPQNKTVITAKYGGFIKNLRVLDGMSVRKGEVLLTIENPELIQLQQEFLEVISSLEYLQAEDERQRNLAAEDASSKKNYQLAHANYLTAVAKRSGLKTKLELAGISSSSISAQNIQHTISIVAPFDGVVTKINTEVGSYAQPTDKLLEVIDLKHAHAEVIVFEKDVPFLRIGQPVSLSFAHGTTSLMASVFLIGKEIGVDRTVKVHCHLDEENQELSPGSFFKAEIKAGLKKQFCVPSESVLKLDGKDVVFLAKKGEKGTWMFYPEEVEVITSSDKVVGIQFLNASIRYDHTIVGKGAYDVYSELIIANESAD